MSPKARSTRGHWELVRWRRGPEEEEEVESTCLFNSLSALWSLHDAKGEGGMCGLELK